MISDVPTYTSVRHISLTKKFCNAYERSVLHEVVMIGGCTSIQDKGEACKDPFTNGYTTDEFSLVHNPLTASRFGGSKRLYYLLHICIAWSWDAGL